MTSSGAAKKAQGNVTDFPVRPTITIKQRKPPEFNGGEKALIKQLHSYWSAENLLKLLNDRLVKDKGDQIGRASCRERV